MISTSPVWHEDNPKAEEVHLPQWWSRNVLAGTYGGKEPE